MRGRSIYLAGVLCALSVTCVLAQCGENAHAVFDFPAGIADPESGLAFVSDAEGIQALNLKDGTTAWTYPQGAIPLFPNRGTLTALAVGPDGEGLAVVFLNCSDGRLTSRPQPFRVPASDARALLRLTQPPLVESRPEEIYLSWPRNGEYAGGANPPVEMLGSSSSQHTAVAKINLLSGESELLLMRPVPDTATRSRENETPYQRGPITKFGTWMASPDTQADLVRGFLSGEPVEFLELKKPDSALISVPIGPLTKTLPYVTVDGAHIIIPAREARRGGQHVIVLSASNGSRIGAIDDLFTLEGASVISTRVYYRSGTEAATVAINAASLPDGKILWRRELSARKQVGRKLSP